MLKLFLKNWLLLNSFICFTAVFCIGSFVSFGQIANYVTNGGFEEKYNCNYPNELSKAKGWNCIGSDTSKTGGLLYAVGCYSNAPNMGGGYQYPRSDDTYYRMSSFCISPCTYTGSRVYPKNRLKASLQANKTYCVKMYVSLEEASPYAISNLSFYFGDNSIDTINYCFVPLTYLNPQVNNPVTSIISDTLNWVEIGGTFTATGNEKYLVLGTFLPNASVTTSLVGADPTYTWSEYFVDDVSCIDIDLPAFAGADTFFIPGSSLYLGRERDVGIDEACTWYQLPNMATTLDTAAGIWVTPVGTSTYVVRQEICGNVKWDTVVVRESPLGMGDLRLNSQQLKLWPQPAKEELVLQLDIYSGSAEIFIFNNLGMMVRSENLFFKENRTLVRINELSAGSYILELRTKESSYRSKLVVER